jgi:Lysozyme inhibitor LprI
MKLKIGLALLAVTLAIPLAGAAECYVQYDSSKCLARQAALQGRLNESYALEEKAMLLALKKYDSDFQSEALKSVRETSSAFAKFKDLECYSSPLKEGMSLKDSAVLSDSCRVKWREKRIKELSRRQVKHAK